MSLNFKNFSPQKNYPIPIYFQLKKFILDAITDHTILPNECLQTEITIAQEVGISRSTVRQAMLELTNEGYLYREKGRGTFVSAFDGGTRFFQRLDSFEREITQKGLVPSTSVLALKKSSPDPEINVKLGISPDADLIYLYRLRCADKEPIIILETFLPYQGYEKLLEVDFNIESLYKHLATDYNCMVVRAIRELEAVEASPVEAKLLNISVKAPICLVKSVAYNNKNIPIEYTIGHYRGDRNKFTMELICSPQK
jgi:GntR family transcriptional regulator